MALFDHDVLMASVDQALASLRAALVARDDAEQTEEARAMLARRAASEVANLPDEPSGAEWPGVPAAVFDVIRQAKQRGREGNMEAAHRHLTRAREMLGGPSV